MYLNLLKIYLRYATRRAMNQVIYGRLFDTQHPEKGRFTADDLRAIRAQLWQNFDALLPQALLQQYDRLGSQQNVMLAVMSLAGYRAFLAAGIERAYAVQLFADMGWRIYLTMLKVPRFIARLLYQAPQKQMNFALHTWLKFPFNYGDQAYQGKNWVDSEGLHTHWYRCPPLEYFRAHGNRDEMDFFSATWCMFDYAAAREMAPGGRFDRPHVMSRGDSLCDMCWYVQKQPEIEGIG